MASKMYAYLKWVGRRSILLLVAHQLTQNVTDSSMVDRKTEVVPLAAQWWNQFSATFHVFSHLQWPFSGSSIPGHRDRQNATVKAVENKFYDGVTEPPWTVHITRTVQSSSRVCHRPSSFPLVSCEPVGLLCNGATRCCTLQKDELGFLGQYELRHYIISQRAHDSLGGKRKGDDRRGHCCVNLVCPPSVMQVMWLSATVNSRIGISGREGTTADSERNGENWESSRPSHQLLFSLAFFAKGRTAQVRFRGWEIISCILAYIEASLSALLPSFPCMRWRFMTNK